MWIAVIIVAVVAAAVTLRTLDKKLNKLIKLMATQAEIVVTLNANTERLLAAAGRIENALTNAPASQALVDADAAVKAAVDRVDAIVPVPPTP